MSRHTNSIPTKVLRFLRKNAPSQYNCKTIYRHIYPKDNKIDDKKLGNIKVALCRLKENGEIRRVTKGFYQAKIDLTLLHQLENPATKLHGIMMECRTLKKLQKLKDGIPSKEFNGKALTLFNALGFLPSTNYRYYRNLWFEGRKITITIHLKGKIDVYINSSKNPITYPEFLKFLTFLDGFLEKLAPFRKRKVVRLKQVGLAKDFRMLRLEGIKSVSLKNFTNAWARVYYKDDINSTRFEHHLTTDMSLDDALKSLSILTNPLNYKTESKPDSYKDVV